MAISQFELYPLRGFLIYKSDGKKKKKKTILPDPESFTFKKPRSVIEKKV
jgi:hypothetical protein